MYCLSVCCYASAQSHRTVCSDDFKMASKVQPHFLQMEEEEEEGGGRGGMPQIIMHMLRAPKEPDNFNFVSYKLPRTTLVRFYLLSNGVQNQVHSPFHSPIPESRFCTYTSLCLCT